MQKLTEAEFTELKNTNVLLLDVRPIEEATENIIANALNIPFGESFLETFQTLVNNERAVVLIGNSNNAAKAIRAISGSGFSNLKGYVLANELTQTPTSVLITLEADEFAMDFNYDDFYLIDVRNADEFNAAHIEFAENISLDDMETMSQDFKEDMRIYVVGATAEQAFTAASILKRNGMELTRAVVANFEEFAQLGLPMIKPKKDKQAKA